MIREAKVKDVDAIVNLINIFAQKGIMLGVSKAYVYEHIRNYIVVEADGKIVGCGALRVHWADMAEVRSLAVDPAYHKNGRGARIVTHLLQMAEEIGVEKVFALTMQVGFFKKLGFKEIKKEELPYKIWKDCINCPKYPNFCDEEAVIINLKDFKKEV